MRKAAAVSSLLFTALPALAQQDSSMTAPKELPSVHLGLGVNVFRGDVGKDGALQTSARPAFTFAVQQRLGNFAGAGLDVTYGKLAAGERSLTRNLNFETTAMQFGLHGIFYFDNDAIMKRGAHFAPYITAGAGYLIFDPHGDLKDAQNRTYHYWSDGSIRSAAESDTNSTAVFLQRDYTYETQLKDSTTNYSRGSLVVPVGLGFRFNFGHKLGGSVAGNYNICFTDYIDNFKEGGNDGYLLLSASIHYKFGSVKTEDKERYADVDFNALEKMDYDEDGVADNRDECPGTPKGVSVDNNGCPLDEDRDGVPDYRDKEPKTKRGVTVDADGVSLNYEQIAQNAAQDSIAALRDSLFQANPSLETLNKIEKMLSGGGTVTGTGGTSSSMPSKKIPAEFQPADKDNNGFISANEITTAIDDFFNGEGDWTVEKINRLIDYFFEQ